MAEENKYDGLFMTVMQQTKDINVFFDAVFGFLRRSTDFFNDEKQAENAITSACAKNFKLYKSDKEQKDKKDEQRKQREEQKKREKEAAEKEKREKEAKEREVKQEQQKQQESQQQPPQYTPVLKAPEKVIENKEIETEKQKDESQNQGDDKEKKEDDKEPAPLGNGGKTERYIWTQTLEEVQIYIPIPKELTSKQLIVRIEADTLLVQIKGQQDPIVKGQYYEKIQSDESTWLITEGEIQEYKGKYIHLSLTKQTGLMNWWNCVLKGDLTINTQKINPEPSKLSDLDGDTRGTVEKMMFDMRQKQQGLPTSDELEKRSKLDQFMKAHPEMDFSKCKFN